MHGEVIIGTTLDTKQLEKQLNAEYRKLQKYESEAEKLLQHKEKLELDVEIKGQQIENEIKKIEEKAKIDIKAVTNGTPYTRGVKEQKINETAQLKINQLQQEYNQYLDNSNKKIKDIDNSLQKNARNQELVNNKVEEYKDKLDQTRNVDNMKNSINGIGDSMKNIVKTAGRWVLAIFSVRSAYSAIRGAISTLSQYDDQMATNIEWIRYLLASTLKPVIESIINLIYKLMVYVNYIAKAWFGIDLFANASKKAFEKAHGAAKKTNKELQKTIAGFDEMNVLSNNKDSSGNNGGISSANFPSMKDVPIPKWVQWIADNKDKILKFFKELALLIAAVKIIKFLSNFSKIGKAIKKVTGFFKTMFDFIGAHAQVIAGIAIAIAGVAWAIDGVIKFIKDPSFNNFIQILEGIAIAVAGVAIAFGAWPVAIGAAIALVIIEIVKNYEKIKDLISKGIKWLDTNLGGGLRKLFGPLGDIMYAPIKFFIEMAKGAFESFYGGIKRVVEGVVKLFKGDFKGGLSDIFGGLLSILLAPFKGFISGVKGVWNHIKESVSYWLTKFGETFKKIKDKMLEPINNFIDAIKNLWDKIKDSVKSVASKIADAFSPSNLINKAKSGISSIGKKFKSFFGFAKGGVVYSRLPKLASGGIINQPGRGVPIASAIGGERAAEGVIPLTDSQQMTLLGEAIGKYININATVPVYVGNRQVAREIKKINAESDFAFNR